MKILHLTNKPIFPLIDGGCIAMEALQNDLLSLDLFLKNLSVSTVKHPFEIDQFPEEVRKKTHPQAVEIDTKIDLFKAVKSIFKRESYNVSRFYHPTFEQLIIDKLSKTKFDVVIIETTYLLPYLSCIREHSSAKIMVRSHNIEFKIWKKVAKNERNFLKKIIYKKLAEDLKRFELNYLKKVDGILSISATDLAQLAPLKISTPATVIPVSMKFENRYTFTPNSNHYFFIGSMNWLPNIEAVDILLKVVFPQILKKNPNATLHLAGSYMSKKLLALQHPNIQIHGKVENVKQFMAEHGTLLVPLKSGSGVRIKIIEAMSIGVPVIGTPIAFEGIPVTDLVHCKIVSDIIDIPEWAIKIDQQSEKAVTLGKNAKEMIVNNYDQKNVAQRLYEFINNQ